MSSPSVIPSDQVTKVAGPFLVGYLVNWGLHGILTTQVYLYYIAFRKDSWKKKALVGSIYTLAIAQTFLFARKAFHTFAEGNIQDTINDITITWFSGSILDGIIACIVQGFYAYRIHILGCSKWLGGLISILALIQLGAAVACAIEMEKAGSAINISMASGPYIAGGIWLGIGALNDIIIAVSMIYYLRRRDSGIKRTHILLRNLIRLTIETGTVTAGVGLLSMMAPIIPGGMPYSQPLICILGQVYANSLMVSLNNRMHISAEPPDVMIQASTLPVFRASQGFQVHSRGYSAHSSEWNHGSVSRDEGIIIHITKGRLLFFCCLLGLAYLLSSVESETGH